MWKDILDFLVLSDVNTQFVVLGSMLLAACTGMVGSFSLLRGRALIGDVIAHAVLPGICLSFIIAETKNPLYLLIGAFASGWLSIIAVDAIKNHTKIKEDTAIATVLSVFFGIGIVMLTSIQHNGNAAQSGLDKFLFGQAASLVERDMWVFLGVSILTVILTIVFFKEFKILCFDASFTTTIGLNARLLEWLLTSITVLAVVAGIQSVGVVLMAALLITPAATARFWTANLVKLCVLAAALGAVSGLIGAFISWKYPSMPTGPWIVMILSILALLSFFFAPKKGVLYKLNLQRKNRELIARENALKLFYHLSEESSLPFKAYTIEELLQARQVRKGALHKGLVQLRRRFLLKKVNDAWQLTQAGLEEGKRVARLHRLWEMYLTTYLNLPADHIHDDAETIEHIITPKIEQWLLQQLDYPKLDPHGEKIPYPTKTDFID